MKKIFFDQKKPQNRKLGSSLQLIRDPRVYWWNIPAGSASSHTDHIPLAAPNQLEWHFKRALSYTGPFVTASYQSSQEITRQDGKIQLREQRELPQRVWNLHSKKEVIFLKRELPPKTSTYCRQDRVGRFSLSCTRAELQCRCLTETMLTFFPYAKVRISLLKRK